MAHEEKEDHSCTGSAAPRTARDRFLLGARQSPSRAPRRYCRSCTTIRAHDPSCDRDQQPTPSRARLVWRFQDADRSRMQNPASEACSGTMQQLRRGSFLSGRPSTSDNAFCQALTVYRGDKGTNHESGSDHVTASFRLDTRHTTCRRSHLVLNDFYTYRAPGFLAAVCCCGPSILDNEHLNQQQRDDPCGPRTAPVFSKRQRVLFVTLSPSCFR